MNYLFLFLRMCVHASAFIWFFLARTTGDYWWLLCIVPTSMIGERVVIVFARRLGYHIDRIAGTYKFRYPVFVKTSPEQALLYASRSKGYQLLYECLNVLLYSVGISLAGILTFWSFLWMMDRNPLLVLVLPLVLFIYGLGLYWISYQLPTWLDLEIIGHEADRPILKKKAK